MTIPNTVNNCNGSAQNILIDLDYRITFFIVYLLSFRSGFKHSPTNLPNQSTQSYVLYKSISICDRFKMLSEEKYLLDQLLEPKGSLIDMKTGNLRATRHLEDVDYWRKRAGWFDDDKSMTDYNHGVYDKFYGRNDDDQTVKKSKAGGGSSKSPVIANTLKVIGVLLAVVLIALLVRTVQRNRASSAETKRESKERSKSAPTRSDRSDGGSRRSRSKSAPGRSRSRSKSRHKTSSNYDLMDDDTESRKSTRSRSNTKRTRSRSRASSRSRSKAGSSSRHALKEPVLV